MEDKIREDLAPTLNPSPPNTNQYRNNIPSYSTMQANSVPSAQATQMSDRHSGNEMRTPTSTSPYTAGDPSPLKSSPYTASSGAPFVNGSTNHHQIARGPARPTPVPTSSTQYAPGSFSVHTWHCCRCQKGHQDRLSVCAACKHFRCDVCYMDVWALEPAKMSAAR